MTRQEFKIAVFAATNGKCCVPGCSCDAVDAHHILNRHLWNDGGYRMVNGAALCEKHHLQAENGTITPRQCMQYMGIQLESVPTPEHLQEYLTDEEYKELLLTDQINTFGELL